jgi:glycosyltransferase involved in cell wall biosynthesis
MPAMRVLYDISGLGLGQISVHGRAGSHRVDRHLTELLSASPECELLFCANHSSLAYQGCVEYLQRHASIGHVPLLRHEEPWIVRGLRQVMVSAHRHVKIRRGGRALPHLVRTGGTLIDGRVHRPIVDATPPVDIHHSSATPLPVRTRRDRSPTRFITIYDLRATRFHASHAELCYQNALVGSVRERDCVMTSSESTRRELCELGVAEPHKIFVAPLAADPATFHPCADGDAEAVRQRYGIPPGPYILMLNGVNPRKNIAHAVSAFAQLIQQERVADLTLVLAGGQAPRSDSIAAAIHRVPALDGRIFSTGYVTDETLASLYRAATAFVYPSLYEGFGLPPLEAMQCGTPVITSNTSSLPEVVGDAGVMVDPCDRDALSGAILALYNDARLRESVRQKCLARAARFSWERTMACAIAAYRAALGV